MGVLSVRLLRPNRGPLQAFTRKFATILQYLLRLGTEHTNPDVVNRAFDLYANFDIGFWDHFSLTSQLDATPRGVLS